MKNGVIVVGGRLVHAPVEDNAKHPKILPKKHHVTDLIVEEHHNKLGHMGHSSVLASLRREFWIIKGNAAVRRIVRKCVKCQKQRAQPGCQFMADLPDDRVSPNKPPFSSVGVDFFGPFEVKQGRSRVKRYGCLFTCLVMRAVHIEVAHTLNTDSMINALRRFISLRGNPERIRSDRGTNFTSAEKELNASIAEWNQEKIHAFCAQRKIEWVFNPPGASHMGGSWERMIRTVRKVLNHLLQEQAVSDEVLTTIMAEAANILNSRPLTIISDDPRDEHPLTPNHLLHLRPCPNLPPGIFGKEDMYCRREWKQAQYISDLFWRRWMREYLPMLQERQKGQQPKENMKVGDVVLLADENYPRRQWPLARIVEVIPSKDGLVRTRKVKTRSTVITRSKRQQWGDMKSTTVILTRPVAKLCKLELDY